VNWALCTKDLDLQRELIIILSSDLGQGSDRPPEGIRMLLYSLLDEGVPSDCIEKMTKAIPRSWPD
jgi:hypothetical protein